MEYKKSLGKIIRFYVGSEKYDWDLNSNDLAEWANHADSLELTISKLIELALSLNGKLELFKEFRENQAKLLMELMKERDALKIENEKLKSKILLD